MDDRAEDERGAVTPPECLAVYAAASISRCSVWGAGWQAVKFAAAGFLVPFFFVHYPARLCQGAWTKIGVALVSGTVGVVALAAGLEGCFLRTATWLERDGHAPARPMSRAQLAALTLIAGEAAEVEREHVSGDGGTPSLISGGSAARPA